MRKKDRIKGGKEKIKLLSGGLNNMTYRDCKRRAISLGMPFTEACIADWGKLMSFISRAEQKPDNSLIDQYDQWVDKILEQNGIPKDDILRSYQLCLGFVSEDENRQKKPKRIKGLEKPKKPKREKDAKGLWKGTKKSYTYELVDKGFSFERIVRRVQKKFPEAKEKSIQQWYRAALRAKGIDYKNLKKK